MLASVGFTGFTGCMRCDVQFALPCDCVLPLRGRLPWFWDLACRHVLPCRLVDMRCDVQFALPCRLALLVDMPTYSSPCDVPRVASVGESESCRPPCRRVPSPSVFFPTRGILAGGVGGWPLMGVFGGGFWVSLYGKHAVHFFLGVAAGRAALSTCGAMYSSPCRLASLRWRCAGGMSCRGGGAALMAGRLVLVSRRVCRLPRVFTGGGDVPRLADVQFALRCASWLPHVCA